MSELVAPSLKNLDCRRCSRCEEHWVVGPEVHLNQNQNYYHLCSPSQNHRRLLSDNIWGKVSCLWRRPNRSPYKIVRTKCHLSGISQFKTHLKLWFLALHSLANADTWSSHLTVATSSSSVTRRLRLFWTWAFGADLPCHQWRLQRRTANIFYVACANFWKISL